MPLTRKNRRTKENRIARKTDRGKKRRIKTNKRKTIKRILDEYVPFQDCAIDGWLGQRHDITKYLVHPSAIPQRDGISDLDASGNSVGVQIFKSSYNVVKKNDLTNEKK
jgi:parallel beta-helix repeat protein